MSMDYIYIKAPLQQMTHTAQEPKSSAYFSFFRVAYYVKVKK